MRIPVLLLLITLNTLAQDKGKFQKKSNEFYSKITSESEKYEQKDKKPSKSFKLDYSNKDIPKSLEEFKIVEYNEPISQGNTGTCWCFSTISFFESEIYRISKKSIDLSELYPVYFEYIEKVREYIKTRGVSHFGQGSETNAVQRMMKIYGIFL